MKIMHYYNITLRLAGSTMNEVRKTVSAPELLILQFVHGTDAVTNVTELPGDKKVRMVDEKARLRARYENGLVKNRQSIDKIFGALGSLPTRLPAELLERFNIDEYIEDSDDDILFSAQTTGSGPKNAKEEERETRIVPTSEVEISDLLE